jgi:chitin deacetylase
MYRALFVERFGEILEHSPHIAEAAHRAGLDARHDSAEGLHGALMTAVREMDRDGKLALIRAHPELAGRLAMDGQLTADSTGEQGRLGFTALSPAEFSRVADINRRYRERHGFPVIVALALHATRDTAIAEMERRIGCDTEAEIATALDQIGHIAMARLVKRLGGG